jgi:putative protein-disulfide isomerase
MELQQKTKETGRIVEKEQVKADRVEIIFYTDPLCCWSWAFEPQWRRLQYELKDHLVFRNVMTGLLPAWKNYSDPVYSVTRPQQMGPVWLEAGKTSGMPIQDKIWVVDPPASSYPACIAVKCIEMQSNVLAVRYLRMLREAVMVEGKNIAKQELLIEIAENLANNYPGLINVRQFAADLVSDKGLEAFRPDWQETQNRNITRTPTLILRSENSPAILLTGYRPYKVLLEAVRQISPAIEKVIQKIDVDEYKRFWGNLTTREKEEIS